MSDLSPRMPSGKHFARLDALKQGGAVSIELIMETLIKGEGLDEEEARSVCRAWLKTLISKSTE